MHISSDLTIEGDGSLTVTDAGTLYEEYPDVQHTSYGIYVNGSLTASSAGIDGNGPQKFSSQAVNAAPTYPSTFTATASTDASGADAETFDSSKLSSYLYFHVE